MSMVMVNPITAAFNEARGRNPGASEPGRQWTCGCHLGRRSL
jgi:hypothetical protein